MDNNATETSTENDAADVSETAAATPEVPAEQQFSPDEFPAPSEQDEQYAADVNLDLILDVPVNVALRIGSTDITIRNLVQLVEGSVVALDREASEPLDVLVNGTLIAHGEIVVVDGNFGVRLTDVVSPAERIRNIAESGRTQARRQA